MFGKRYLAIAVSIFAIGVVFGAKVFNADTFSFRAIFAVIAILSACACVYFVRTKSEFASKRIIAATFAVAAFSFGALRVGLYNDAALSSKQYDRKNDLITVAVSEIKADSAEVKVISSELGIKEGEKLRFYTDNKLENLVAGDILIADVKYKFQNSEKYYSSDIALTANGEVLETKNGESVFCSVRRFVSASAKKLYKGFDYAEPISKAVTVGDKSGLDSYIYSVYNSGGVSHILAISGLHLTLIAFCFQKLLVLISLSKKTASVVSSIVILGYAAFVGFTPSVTRAAIMILAIMLSRIFIERADSITMLFLALALLLVLNPYSIFSISLQLSFISCLAILVSAPIMDRIDAFFEIKRDLTENRFVKLLLSLANAVISPAIMSFSATVFSFFIILTTFDSVSYVSPLVNIFAVPIFSYGLVFTVIAFIVASFSMPIAIILAKPAGYIFELITDVSAWIHKEDIGKLSTHVDWIFIPCVFAGVMIISLLFLHRYRLKAFTFSAIAFCLSIFLCGALNDYTRNGITVIEYGNFNGEYVFYSNENDSVYFDVGGYSSEPTVIFENGLTSLDKYVLTKYDGYTLKSIEFFSGRASISQMFLPKPKNIYEIDIYNQIKFLANKRNYDIIEFDKELIFEFNGMSINLISDDMLSAGSYIEFEDENDLISVFIDGFPAVNQYDMAIFNSFSEEYLDEAHFNKTYFIENTVENDSYLDYINTFSNKITIISNEGESDRIYES